jgi:peptidyl-prolyl cis-trans isomerase D
VRVVKIEPGQARSYEQVADEIKQDVASEQARSEISALRDKLEDNRAAGDTLAEAAQKLNLQSRNIAAVDRSGRGPDGAPVSDLPNAAEVVQAAYATGVGVENDPLQTEAGGYLWYDVVGITPSRERTLEEVKNEVEIRWRNDEIATRLKAKADSMLDKLNGGTAFKDVAAAHGLQLQIAWGLKRGAPTETFSAAALDAIFRTAKDAAGSAPGEQATRQIVFRVTDITVAKLDMASEEAKRVAETWRSSLANDLLGEYAAFLEKQVGVTINVNALNQVSGGGTN